MFEFYLMPKILIKIFPQFIWETNDGTILLTIDDSPSEHGTLSILKILKENNIKSLFFVTGKQAEKYPDIVKEIYNNGHLIGNHSYSHKSYLFMQKKKILEDIKRTNTVIKNITGCNTIYFRPPYGHFRFCIKNTNLKTIMWKVFTYDYRNNKNNVKFAVQKLSKGSIVVLHDNFKTENNLENNFNYLINYVSQKGLIFGDPNKCLN
ncbi:MAG: polysaccharide deacetylase family protein [bacterium]